MGTASDFMHFLRPEDFGLTSPPRAEALVPNAQSRKPTLRERFANISNIYCWLHWYLYHAYSGSEDSLQTLQPVNHNHVAALGLVVEFHYKVEKMDRG